MYNENKTVRDIGQLSASFSGSPIKQSEVVQELERLSNAVELLNKVSDVISNRLEQVVRPDTPKVETEKVGELPQTQIASGIFQNRMGVEIVIHRLESILSRLEL